MTRAAICRHLGGTRNEIGSVVSRLNRPTTTQPKRIYILRYTYEDEGSNVAYPRAVYALGNKPDAIKPEPNRNEVARRWRERSKVRVNSVFEWAMPRRARAQYRKALLAQAGGEG